MRYIQAKAKRKGNSFRWNSVADPGRGPGSRPPLFLYPTESAPPPPPPPILPSYLKVFIRHWNGIFEYYEQDIKQFNFYCCCVTRLPSFSSYIVHNRGLMQLFYCDITQLCVIRTSRESDHINTNEEHLAITNGRKI